MIEASIDELVAVFRNGGSAATIEALHLQLGQSEKLRAWRALAAGPETCTRGVPIHPNEAAALRWLNGRFARMGLSRLIFRAENDARRQDPTAIDYSMIGPRKWLRYVGGPGVAAAAAVLSLPSSGQWSTSAYLLSALPALMIGLAGVLLEAQFAWPWLNNLVWKRVHKFGGLVGARFVNIAINFLYGISLYGVGLLGSAIARSFGGVPPATLAFDQAVAAAFFGAWTFDLALGLFLTDIAQREEHGAITANTRYALETSGLIIVNGARVATWVLPPGFDTLPYLAQAAFFLSKTLPQFLQTTCAERLDDLSTRRTLEPATPLPPERWERAARALASLRLVNLPRLVRYSYPKASTAASDSRSR